MVHPWPFCFMNRNARSLKEEVLQSALDFLQAALPVGSVVRCVVTPKDKLMGAYPVREDGKPFEELSHRVKVYKVGQIGGKALTEAVGTVLGRPVNADGLCMGGSRLDVGRRVVEALAFALHGDKDALEFRWEGL